MGPKPFKHIPSQSSLSGFVQNAKNAKNPPPAPAPTLHAPNPTEEWDKNPHCIRMGALCYKHENGAYVRVPCEDCAVCRQPGQTFSHL